MKVQVRKVGTKFIADPIGSSSSPACGLGSTFDAALGDFLRVYQQELGVEIVVHETTEKTEAERRRRELSKR